MFILNILGEKSLKSDTNITFLKVCNVKQNENLFAK